MARIKAVKYDFEGVEVEVAFNCSVNGVFSTNLKCTIQEKLGLPRRLEGMDLKDLENTITHAFQKYKESKTTRRLIIGISFGACGKFTQKSNGEWNEKFIFGHNSPYRLSLSCSNLNSAVGFEYRIMVEENRDGRISYYTAEHISTLKMLDFSNKVIVGEFCAVGGTYVPSTEKLIDYSETAVRNLISITKQLQKASEFLIDLVSSEDTGLMLSANSLIAIGD